MIALATSTLMVITVCGKGNTVAGPVARAAVPSPVTAAPTAYPLTIDNCGRGITFDKAPSRVVLLNGTSVAEVESFVALGISDRIVANSQSYGVSDEPSMVADIAAVPTGGVTLNQNYEVPKEQVLALKPDLVVSTWAGGFDEKIGSIGRDQLEAAGINSFVTPSNCGNGDPAPRPEDEERYRAQSVESSTELLIQLGRIFDVQQRAVDLVNQSRAQLDDIARRIAGKPAKSVLVVYPGMAMMNNNGLPAVFGGGIYDDIIARAGGTNPFGGRTNAELSEINAEAMASAEVDVLVIGLFQASENAGVFADDLFKKFPQWAASKTRTFTAVSDSIYLGPFNAIAVRKIADAAHGA
ncbi:ABC transporter substrate-binding protein [Umezawaea sp. Da 62-37]|uniref:ABC transporter substrate-binding protein n=1 Tax=Umezawaea sp. Da 62-37 TaxID=3075927 RepID=UPI0028F74F56|nr:ABC transporter substrate-binding protein [Umezawaea sp. Da 62-37]WNV86982.1 ABC transporter substrate-binding protein [Umezawaea sp. Da 62-37]